MKSALRIEHCRIFPFVKKVKTLQSVCKRVPLQISFNLFQFLTDLQIAFVISYSYLVNFTYYHNLFFY